MVNLSASNILISLIDNFSSQYAFRIKLIVLGPWLVEIFISVLFHSVQTIFGNWLNIETMLSLYLQICHLHLMGFELSIKPNYVYFDCHRNNLNFYHLYIQDSLRTQVMFMTIWICIFVIWICGVSHI